MKGKVVKIFQLLYQPTILGDDKANVSLARRLA